MPQMSKFTQALADDANKDKGLAAGLAGVGGIAVGVGMSRAKNKTNALKEAVLNTIDKGPNLS